MTGLFLLLGMHRSGTSAFASQLIGLGCDPGRDLMPAAEDNQAGFNEHRAVVAQHEALLNAFGLSWDRPTPLPVDWLKDKRTRDAVRGLEALLESDFDADRPWLVKDPRLCLLAPLWTDVASHFGRALKVCAILRHPEEAIASLMQRNRIGAAWAAQLYRTYCIAMRDYVSRHKDAFWTTYAGLMGDPERVICGLKEHFHADFSNVGKSTEDIIGKLHPSLQHQRRRSISPTSLGRVYEALFSGSEAAPDAQALESWFEVLDASSFEHFQEFTRLETSKAYGLEPFAKDHSELKGEPQAGRSEAPADEASPSAAIHQQDQVTILKARVSGIQSVNAELEKQLQRKTTELELGKEEAQNSKDIFERQDREIGELRQMLAAQKQIAHDATAQREQQQSMYESELSSLRSSIDELRDAEAQHEQRRTEYESEIAELRNTAETLSFQLDEMSKNHQSQLAVVNFGWQHHAESLENQLHELRQRSESEKTLVRRDSEFAQKRLRHELQVSQTRYHKIVSKIAETRSRPLLHGSKSVLWGVLRSLFRALPASSATKARLVNRIVPRLRGLAPNQPVFEEIHNGGSVPLNWDVDVSELTFDEVDQPEISVIVPVFNELAYTLNCLASLSSQQTEYDFEVIVMDDCSSDATQETLFQIPNLRYVRNEQNLRFIRNCNRGAQLARGRYLLFLNNDTYAPPQWLQTMRETFDEHTNVGIVGCKLLFEDGRLQEAGGIIWKDGSGWNWGRGKDADHPRYNFVRDVDYVSGAAFMVARDVFIKTGCFDEDLQYAYYEDTSKCFQLRELGLRTLYQPAAALVHYEGVSNGTDLASGLKKYQLENQKIFRRKHEKALAKHFSNGMLPDKASDRGAEGHVLIIDHTTPTPDRDSGSIDMFNLIRVLLSLRYRVHFVPQDNYARLGHYTTALQRLGAECIYAPFYSNIDEYLKERGDSFDFVILSRAHYAAATIDSVERYAPSAARIFYTVDLHFLREQREAVLTNSPAARKRADARRKLELELMDRCHSTIVLSEAEKQLLDDVGQSRVVVLPLLRAPQERVGKPFAQRKRVVFIGSYQHAPNVDAVEWLVSEIWPAFQKLFVNEKDVPKLRIVGSSMPDSFKAFANQNVELAGFVPDLADVFDDALASVACLRYGAGLKGKVATSLEYGVPVVGTDIAFEGMPEQGLADIAVMGRDAVALARELYDLCQDETRWAIIAKAGKAYVEKHLSLDGLRPRVADILAAAAKNSTAD